MITIILFMLFFVMLLKYYEKTYILLIITSVFLRHFTLFNDSLYTYISIFAVCLFPFKLSESFFLRKEFPFTISIFCLIISLIISNLASSIKHNFLLINNIINLLHIPFIWIILQKNAIETIRFTIKTAIVFGSIISFYSLFETITRTNPFIKFVNNLNLYSNDYFITEIRYGLKRSQSIFSMHTTNGGISLILSTILLYAKQQSIIYFSRFKTLIIYLLIATIFFTGSRAAIIGCFISLFMLISKETLKGKKNFFVFTCILLLSTLLYNYLNAIYLSFTDTQNVVGSNSDMRTTQFELALLFLNKNFWFGNGLAYTWEYVLYYYDELLGAESLWIPIMIDQGIIGVISYVILIINCIVFAYKNNQGRLLFFILGFFVFNTLSSIPNVSYIYVPFSLMIMNTINKISVNNKLCFYQ